MEPTDTEDLLTALIEANPAELALTGRFAQWQQSGYPAIELIRVAAKSTRVRALRTGPPGQLSGAVVEGPRRLQSLAARLKAIIKGEPHEGDSMAQLLNGVCYLLALADEPTPEPTAGNSTAVDLCHHECAAQAADVISPPSTARELQAAIGFCTDFPPETLFVHRDVTEALRQEVAQAGDAVSLPQSKRRRTAGSKFTSVDEETGLESVQLLRSLLDWDTFEALCTSSKMHELLRCCRVVGGYGVFSKAMSEKLSWWAAHFVSGTTGSRNGAVSPSSSPEGGSVDADELQARELCVGRFLMQAGQYRQGISLLVVLSEKLRAQQCQYTYQEPGAAARAEADFPQETQGLGEGVQVVEGVEGVEAEEEASHPCSEPSVEPPQFKMRMAEALFELADGISEREQAGTWNVDAFCEADDAIDEATVTFRWLSEYYRCSRMPSGGRGGRGGRGSAPAGGQGPAGCARRPEASDQQLQYHCQAQLADSLCTSAYIKCTIDLATQPVRDSLAAHSPPLTAALRTALELANESVELFSALRGGDGEGGAGGEGGGGAGHPRLGRAINRLGLVTRRAGTALEAVLTFQRALVWFRAQGTEATDIEYSVACNHMFEVLQQVLCARRKVAMQAGEAEKDDFAVVAAAVSGLAAAGAETQEDQEAGCMPSTSERVAEGVGTSAASVGEGADSGGSPGRSSSDDESSEGRRREQHEFFGADEHALQQRARVFGQHGVFAREALLGINHPRTQVLRVRMIRFLQGIGENAEAMWLMDGKAAQRPQQSYELFLPKLDVFASSGSGGGQSPAEGGGAVSVSPATAAASASAPAVAVAPVEAAAPAV
jgi:hypothetical protein